MRPGVDSGVLRGSTAGIRLGRPAGEQPSAAAGPVPGYIVEGDSIRLVGVGEQPSGLMPTAKNHARALIGLLQLSFPGKWVSAKDVKHWFYPSMCQELEIQPLSYLSVARQLSKLTRKREKELRWNGCRTTVTQYLIPKRTKADEQDALDRVHVSPLSDLVRKRA